MEPSAELSEALASQRLLVERLEVELAPRRAAEAKDLEELTTKLTRLRDGIARARARVQKANEQRPLREADLQKLQVGLSAAREAWVRVLEPLLSACALMLVIFGLGLSGGRDWAWQVGAGLGGLAAARLARLVRR